ncbi:DEAD/DEAH box helicase [Pseudonocardia sp. TMWB2A]|uniref:DEAD/DEAH box helicase n=1 Tax=Pseudonocardia sp. TMWB2A TaxID=687430 RepID=UPI003FCF57CC
MRRWCPETSGDHEPLGPLPDAQPRGACTPLTRALTLALTRTARLHHRDGIGRHLSSPDVVLELPTGAGKTLPGLLITEWRRQMFGRPVVYACPTQNLARQTARAAERVGLDIVIPVCAGWQRHLEIRTRSGRIHWVDAQSWPGGSGGARRQRPAGTSSGRSVTYRPCHGCRPRACRTR